MTDYIPILLWLAVVGGTAVMMLAMATFIGPKRTNPVKELPFETGNLPTPGGIGQPVPINFFLVAIIFVVFDLEVAFLYPWAVNFTWLGWFGFVEMLVFILILGVGWLYIIKRGVLGWK